MAVGTPGTLGWSLRPAISHRNGKSLSKEAEIQVCLNPPEENLDQSHFSGQLQLKVLALSAVVIPTSEKPKTVVNL